MKILRTIQNTDGSFYCFAFWCPGCEEYHQVWTDQSSPQWEHKWSFNGDMEKPTFSPSLLIRSGHFSEGFKEGDECWCTYKEKHPEDQIRYKCGICHMVITDGRIAYCGDSTHALSGQTVDMIDTETLSLSLD